MKARPIPDTATRCYVCRRVILKAGALYIGADLYRGKTHRVKTILKKEKTP